MLKLAALAACLAMPAWAGEMHAEQMDGALMPMKMSCGERLNAWRPVASVEHGFAPCLSWLKVISLETDKAVIVQVIDDDQFGADGVTILLSPEAADLIGMKRRAAVLIVPLKERR